jgi:hypothetical protein
MAKSHYSADSASLPPSSLMLQVRSAWTGARSCASVPDFGNTLGPSFAATTTSIG